MRIDELDGCISHQDRMDKLRRGGISGNDNSLEFFADLAGHFYKLLSATAQIISTAPCLDLDTTNAEEAKKACRESLEAETPPACDHFVGYRETMHSGLLQQHDLKSYKPFPEILFAFCPYCGEKLEDT